MSTVCFDPIYGKMLRATELNSCGGLITGESPSEEVTTDGYISITMSAETEDGAEIITRKANGSLCINERQANSFKRLTLEIHFCGVNPSLLSIVSNAEPYLDGEDVVGFTIPEGELNKWFGFELWTGVTGAACAPGASEQSGLIVLPFVNAGTLGDIEITGEDAIDFSITGAYTKGGNQWGRGFYPDVYAKTGTDTPGYLPTPLDPFDHFLLINNYGPIPASSCEAVPVPTPPEATGATAGEPGEFTPAGALPPANFAALVGGSIVASPATAWTAGQSVILGDSSEAHWSGTAWVAGPA